MKRLLFLIAAAVMLLSSCGEDYPAGVTYEGDAVESLSPATKAILETVELPENGSLVVHVDSICPKNDYMDKVDAPTNGMVIYAYLEPKIIKAEIYGAAGGELAGRRGKEYLAEQTAYSQGVPVDEALVSMARLLEDVRKEADQKYSGWFQNIGVTGARDFVNDILYGASFIIKPYDNFWGTLMTPFYNLSALCATWTGSVAGGLSLMVFLLSVSWLFLYMCLIMMIKKRKEGLRKLFLVLLNALMFLALFPILIYTVCFAVPNHEILVAMQDIYGYVNAEELAGVYVAHTFAPSSVGMAIFAVLTFLVFKLLCWYSTGGLDKSDEQTDEFGNNLGEKLGEMLPLFIGAVVLDKILLWAFALFYIFRIVCKAFDLLLIHSKPFARFIGMHTNAIALALVAAGIVGFFCFGIGGEASDGDAIAAREQAFARKIYSQGQIDTMSYVTGMDLGRRIRAIDENNIPEIDLAVAQRGISQMLRYGKAIDLAYDSKVDSVSWYVGQVYGTVLRDLHITGMGEFNMERFRQGYDDFIHFDGNLWVTQIDGVVDDWVDAREEYVAQHNLQVGKVFLEKNMAREGMNVSESGLQYVIHDPGKGRKLRSSSTVKVNYKGTALDGRVFDAGDGVQFKVNRLIKGWQEGLCMLAEGGKMTMYIPSELAYGERWSGNVEPNSVLIFDVEVVKVVKR